MHDTNRRGRECVVEQLFLGKLCFECLSFNNHFHRFSFSLLLFISLLPNLHHHFCELFSSLLSLQLFHWKLRHLAALDGKYTQLHISRTAWVPFFTKWNSPNRVPSRKRKSFSIWIHLLQFIFFQLLSFQLFWILYERIHSVFSRQRFQFSAYSLFFLSVPRPLGNFRPNKLSRKPHFQWKCVPCKPLQHCRNLFSEWELLLLSLCLESSWFFVFFHHSQCFQKPEECSDDCQRTFPNEWWNSSNFKWRTHFPFKQLSSQLFAFHLLPFFRLSFQRKCCRKWKSGKCRKFYLE